MDTGTLTTTQKFQPHALLHKLRNSSEAFHTGYWEVHLHSDNTILYLSVFQGRVVFAGTQHLSWQTLLKCLYRYIPQLRTTAAREAIAALENSDDAMNPRIFDKMLGKLESTLNVTYSLIHDAVQTQILTVCDRIWEGCGEAIFTPVLSLQSPLSGMTVESLIVQMQARQQDWQLLKTIIPSMEAIPVLNSAALSSSKLSFAQQQQIEKLTSLRKPLDSIAQITAKDPLTTAITFSNLVRGGLVFLKPPSQNVQVSSAKIFIVDDSTIFLQQFQALVSNWGYGVTVCSTTETAIETMMLVQPDLIFLDINMPGLSGFDLIKAVRREDRLKDKKLVLLTAENSQSNQWRAKWGNCKFLAKPRVSEEIQSFQVDLRRLLQEEIPVTEQFSWAQ